MDIGSFKKDRRPIEDGVWVDIKQQGNLRLKVRGMTAMIVRDARARAERAVPADQRDEDGSLNAAAGLQALGTTCHEAVLLDWDGLTDAGKPIKYSKALATEWLTNPDYEKFLDTVVWAARQVDIGKATLAEAAVGN